MISSKTESIHSRIEELIFDENKIVSSSWLSKTLRLHPNLSKQISAIDYNCNERNNEVLNQLKLNALPKLFTQPKSASSIGSTTAKTTKSSINNIVDDSNGVINSEMNKEPSPGKKTNIHQMFKNSVAVKKKNEKVSGNTQKTGSIGSFFSKTAKPSDEKPKLASVVKLSTEEKPVLPAKERISPTKENKATLNISNENTSDKGKELFSTTRKDNFKPKSMRNNGETRKSKKKIVKKDTEDKKRKRLVLLSDSDSNSSEADDIEIEREPTPEPQPSLLPDECEDDLISGTPEPSKKRKKKLISKSFTSPDGFLMTEKVYVSCSEEEEEAPLKKLKGDSLEDKNCSEEPAHPSENTTIKSPSKRVVTKTKNSSPQKVKQSSLMSFFTKK